MAQTHLRLSWVLVLAAFCLYFVQPTLAQRSLGEKEFTVFKVELDSVSSDLIGEDSGGMRVYATSMGSGNVTIQLKSSPVGVALPSGLVTWMGGSPGVDQLQRIVSRSSLLESGESVVAAAPSGTVFSGRIYVFKGVPPSAYVWVNITVTRDDSITTGNPFGLTDRAGAWTPTETYEVYYQNKEWRFVFYTVAYEVKWGMCNGGRTDVPDGAANPFPLGMNMPAGSTETAKKTQAKTDLTPDASGEAWRSCYWASALTQKHELFHVSDWRDDYYTPKTREAEVWIESQRETVTLSNLTPADVLNTKVPAFHGKLIETTDEANTAFGPDKETRAYGDGKAAYQALADSIIP